MNPQIRDAIDKVNASQEKFLASFEEFGEALIRFIDAVQDLKRWL